MKNKIWPLITRMLLHFLDQNKPEIFLQDGRWMSELFKKLEVENVRAGMIVKPFFYSKQFKRSLYQGKLTWKTRFHEYFQENNLRIGGPSGVTVSRTVNGWTRLLDTMGKTAHANFMPPSRGTSNEYQRQQ